MENVQWQLFQLVEIEALFTEEILLVNEQLINDEKGKVFEYVVRQDC